MGANEKFISGLIGQDQSTAAAAQFQPLANKDLNGPRRTAMSERERQAYERGRREGFGEGLAAGAERARLEWAGHQQAVERVLSALRARFAELESAGADAVLDLALEVARQVVRRDIEVRRDAVLPPLREAVALVVEHHAHPQVHMNPADLELLRADLNADGTFKGCRFVADASVERGGCRVETDKGDVDAQLATRWRRVLAALGVEAQGT